MDSTGISLQKFQMNTALSEISAQIKAGNGIFTQNSQTPVEARLQAKLAIGDIIRVLPEYDNYTRGLLLSTGFLSNISMNGTLGDIYSCREHSFAKRQAMCKICTKQIGLTEVSNGSCA